MNDAEVSKMLAKSQKRLGAWLWFSFWFSVLALFLSVAAMVQALSSW